MYFWTKGIKYINASVFLFKQQSIYKCLKMRQILSWLAYFTNNVLKKFSIKLTKLVKMHENDG